jgi:tRNA pseudouridine55 synthase
VVLSSHSSPATGRRCAELIDQNAKQRGGSQAMRATTHGILIVDKPSGPTSHDLVAQARKLYRTRAVGHAGTLDPMATGVMLLLFGQATRLSSQLAGQAKRYRATVSFGRATDTLDAEGQPVAEHTLEDGWLSEPALAAALQAERDRTVQRPPAFSALKVGGRRAHRLSRSGELVELEPRRVSVQQLILVQTLPAAVVVEITVSNGYYVRALARDLGARLGVPAHLSALRRLASGSFDLSEAIDWPPPEPPPPLPLAAAARRVLPCAELTAAGVRAARHGQRLAAADFVDDPTDAHAAAARQAAPVAWFDAAGGLVALGEQREGGVFVVIRGFGFS